MVVEWEWGRGGGMREGCGGEMGEGAGGGVDEGESEVVVEWKRWMVAEWERGGGGGVGEGEKGWWWWGRQWSRLTVTLPTQSEILFPIITYYIVSNYYIHLLCLIHTVLQLYQ